MIFFQIGNVNKKKNSCIIDFSIESAEPCRWSFGIGGHAQSSKKILLQLYYIFKDAFFAWLPTVLTFDFFLVFHMEKTQQLLAETAGRAVLAFFPSQIFGKRKAGIYRG